MKFRAHPADATLHPGAVRKVVQRSPTATNDSNVVGAALRRRRAYHESMSLRNTVVWGWLAFAAFLCVGCGGDDDVWIEVDEPGWVVANPQSHRTYEDTFRPIALPSPNAQRTASGAPGRAYWQQRADYAIDVELDAARNEIRGTATVTYTNQSPDPLPYVWLHLEQNLFRKGSLGSVAHRGSGRFNTTGSSSLGYDIEAVTTAAGEPLSLAVYDSVGRLDLPSPVAPDGGKLVFKIGWRFRIPEDEVMRFGMEQVQDGVIWELAQWFPAVAVYDDAHGWNTLPYLGNGEFYTNFGTYDVAITVPSDHLVAATGVLLNPEDVLTPTQRERLDAARRTTSTVTIRGMNEVRDPGSRPKAGKKATWKFRADDVRTFAWASSPAFIWDACSTGGVLVQSFYPREGAKTWAKATDDLRFSIEHYSKTWFPYPYPVATNVNGREGGMEYPMIVFCSEREDPYDLWYVTTHEIGHNWFPMMVNNDERRHAWMDEGLNTFINWYASIARYPGRPWPGRWRGVEPSARFPDYGDVIRDPRRQPIETVPDRVEDPQIGTTQYRTVAVGLVVLREKILGPERFDAAFREYIRRWAFKSPRPADFFRSMEDAAGCDLAWWWRGWFLSTDTLDHALESVRSMPDQRGTMVTEIVVKSVGRMVCPAEFEVRWDDGTTSLHRIPVEAWATTDRYVFTLQDRRRAAAVRLNPDGGWPDVNPANDQWVR